MRIPVSLNVLLHLIHMFFPAACLSILPRRISFYHANAHYEMLAQQTGGDHQSSGRQNDFASAAKIFFVALTRTTR